MTNVLQKIPLGELVERVDSASPAKRKKGSSFKYVDIASINRNHKIIEAVNSFGVHEAPSRARQIIKKGDVLVSTVRPNLNAVALVPAYLDGEIASTGFTVLRPKTSNLDSRYLFQWVKHEAFISYLVKNATGASYPAVTDKIVKSSLIPVPSLEEQKRIARILDAADALRAKRREALAQLDTLLQATFLDMFGDPVTGQDHAFVELAEPGRGTFSNGPFGSDLLTSELVESGVPVIYIRDIRNGEYDRVSTVHVTEEKAQQLDACQVHPGDILIAKVGDPPGIAAVYPPKEPLAIITQDTIRIRPNRKMVTSEFIVGYLNSRAGKHLIKGITVEATRARFSLGDLKRLRVAIPPLERQQKFSRMVTAAERMGEVHRAHLAELDTLFASLQSRAFRGDL